VIGLSILSGAHGLLVPEVIDRLRAEGVDPSETPVIVGGVIPEDDERKLLELGVAKVYTPKDFDLSKMLGEIADLVAPA
jgi:(2R)-ethylmalonyl-CoA mutase